MRLFIGVELSCDLIEALTETMAALRADVRGRYVAPDSFHVTLAFLGEVEADRIHQIEDVLEEGCSGVEPFSVSLGDLGSFGRRSKAVLWQGFDDAGLLPELAVSVRAGLRSRGLPYDERPFLPHVTLMRSTDLLGGQLPVPIMATGRVDSVVLFRSHLSGDLPVYEPLYRFLLQEAPVYR